MRSRSITSLDGEALPPDFYEQSARRGLLAEAVRAGCLKRSDQCGFVLASAIFLLVIMAALAAFMVQVTIASQTSSGQDVQGARAYQAARLGIEAGLYAVQVNGNCPGGTLSGVAGLNGFKVTWACALPNPPLPFTESGVNNRRIWQITSTACTTAGATCPSSTDAEMQSADYTERQLVVVTER
jgi:MSHA biogenesis protein MshP